MATIQEINLVRTNTPAEQSPQKIHPLCAWVKENKKSIAVALMIVAIAAVTFGIGAIAAAAAGAAVTASVVGGKLVFALGINKALLVSGIAAIAAGLFTMGFSSGYLAALKK